MGKDQDKVHRRWHQIYFISTNTAQPQNPTLSFFMQRQAIGYIDHLNCYLFSFGSEFFRKDSDENFPYLFTDVFRVILSVLLQILWGQPKSSYPHRKEDRILRPWEKATLVWNCEISYPFRRNQRLQTIGSKRKQGGFAHSRRYNFICSLNFHSRKVYGRNEDKIQLMFEEWEHSLPEILWSEKNFS